ncbi:hypothetical protein PMIN03_000860 [Paraphaeosphaeria minitans]|uniref:Uncharacterized protein n=1 Tax=Paraphaeosphaeria minitans TaxID=565426 RepID=A0A9P6GN58_9PLEO|nr:hypothetical protein PMIN01_05229 [Paraphaeosphaeria minitans]
MKITILAAALAGLACIANCTLSDTADTLFRQISSAIFDSPTVTTSNETYAPEATTRLQEREDIARRANWDDSPMASDELWCAAQAKGAQMYYNFWKSDATAGRAYNPPRLSANSVFRADNMNNMMYSTWGWSDGDRKYNDAVFNEYYGPGWIDCVRARGIGITPWQDIYAYNFKHGVANARDEHGQPIPLNEQSYQAYGNNYRVTGARSTFGVQDKAGSIMVSIAVSPAESFKALYGREAHPDELPQLRSLSDLLWAGWQRGSNPHNGNPNVKNLNSMFMMWIINRDTLSIMKRALHARGKDKYSVWPGDDFSTAEPEGQALLGSPNGKPMGYLVNQRKLDMGVKLIYNIRVFTGKPGDFPIMMFWLQNILNDQIQNQ